MLARAFKDRETINRYGISLSNYGKSVGLLIDIQWKIWPRRENLVHILWVDDLILFSDTYEGKQTIKMD